MRIEASERVVYQHNPLAEVVCQVRFDPIGQYSDDDLETFRRTFEAKGYGVFSEEITVGFTQTISHDGGQPTPPVAHLPNRIRHYSSIETQWRVSVAQDFIALTCTKYTNWGDFLPRFLELAEIFVDNRENVTATRVGLRYKDVIEREPLGLDDAPWDSLIQPFLLGPLAPDALAEGQTAAESDVVSFFSQGLLRVENSMLLLQSSLLTSIDGNRRAFLIDADFFHDSGIEPDMLRVPALITTRLEILHENAGALFRRGITQRLHNGLRPNS